MEVENELKYLNINMDKDEFCSILDQAKSIGLIDYLCSNLKSYREKEMLDNDPQRNRDYLYPKQNDSWSLNTQQCLQKSLRILNIPEDDWINYGYISVLMHKSDKTFCELQKELDTYLLKN